MRYSGIMFAAFIGVAVVGHAALPGYFDVKSDIIFATGESWIQDGHKYRLYGVQSCLRGTFYTAKDRTRHDCGEAAITMFAAYIRDTQPVCAPVLKGDNLTYVMCYANVGGKALDLGTILISTGFAFAALNVKGMPYLPAYAVAEQQAREKKSGFWAFPDVRHPSFLISKAANEKGTRK